MRKSHFAILGVVLACSSVSADELPTYVERFAKSFCADCHQGELAEGGFDVASLTGPMSQRATFDRLVRFYDRVAQKEMPPEDAMQPDKVERQRALTVLKRALVSHEREIEKQVGRTILRRLNRVEYENTVRDLLHIDIDLQNLLPDDTPLYGFDTVAEGLRFSQLQIEKYLDAATAALDAAIVLREEPERVHRRISLKEEDEFRRNLDKPEGVDPDSGEKHRVIFRETDDAVILFASGGNLRSFNAHTTGRYRIRLSGYAIASQGDPVGLQLFAHRWHARRLVGFFQMPEAEPREVEFMVHLNERELLQIQPHATDFDADGKGVWNYGAGEYKGRGLAVQWAEVEGPLGSWPPKSMTSLFGKSMLRELPKGKRPWRDGHRVAYVVEPANPEQSAREIVTRFAERAFRRPLQPREAEPFVGLAIDGLRDGREFVDSVRIGLKAVLISPQFLLFDEQPGQLSSFAVAGRLAAFLTSRMPDELLRAAAQDGSLLKPQVLKEHTDRLLESPRSNELIHNFTGQWLDLRRINATSPDERLYPEFDPFFSDRWSSRPRLLFVSLLTAIMM